MKVNLTHLKNALAKVGYGMTVDEAHEKGICICCKNPPTWYSEAGKREYQLSGMCEHCFDKEFADSD